MGLSLLRISLLILFIGTYLSNDISASSMSKRPTAFLVEFYDKKNDQKQSSSFATISLVDMKQLQTDRHLKISRSKNPEKFADIFHKLYQQLVNRKHGLLHVTEDKKGEKEDHSTSTSNPNVFVGPIITTLCPYVLQSTDIITEIKRALGGRDEFSTVLNYLDMSKEEILKQLPSNGPIRFLAPTNFVFSRLIPQDVADPFYTNTQFRTKALLKQFITKKSVNSNSDVHMNKLIQLCNNTGDVYIVDKLLTTSQEIEEALRPGQGTLDSPTTPFFLSPERANRREVIINGFKPTEVVTSPIFNRATTTTRPNNPPTTTKRFLPLIGGYNQANVNDRNIKEIATFAASTMSSNENTGPLSLVKIIKAETQLTAGRNYKMTLELIQQIDSKSIICDVIVFDQPWTKIRELHESKCAPNPEKVKKLARETPPTLDGFNPAEIDADDVKDMALFAETSLSISENKGPLALDKIVSAKTQVLAGMNYKMVLQFIQKADYKPLHCEVIVFYQSWTETRRMVKSNCFSP